MILEAKDLTRVYVQGDDTIRAVDGCNLTVNEGDFITITGSSGCGKSTLLGLLGGIDTPDGGKVYLDGESMYDAADDRLSDIRAQKIGFVFQNFSLLPTLTAAENIRLPCLISGKSFSRFYFDEL
ncbi:MAG: ABC transporter ATP-binding protein [Clostridia bacterium]|nr:ABC transporter ATP-binding protein [Clostridia bacterium]